MSFHGDDGHRILGEGDGGGKGKKKDAGVKLSHRAA